MASRSGRRGMFLSPEERKKLEQDMADLLATAASTTSTTSATAGEQQQETTTAAATTSTTISSSILTRRRRRRQQRALPSSREVQAAAVASTSTSVASDAEQEGNNNNNNSSEVGQDMGCLVCGVDSDHDKMLLCESCNGEYHTFCLSPPLESIPESAWYCDLCKPDDTRDGLEELVYSLPPEITSRFGEICWAQGGIGFGWWPSCIYDPRLTVGTARMQARKNLGKRFLVYFFECSQEPFSVLTGQKIITWEEGIAEEFHLGRTARATGKHRLYQFRQALQAATIEESKPVDRRLDWNHQSGNNGAAQLLPSPEKLAADERRKNSEKQRRGNNKNKGSSSRHQITAGAVVGEDTNNRNKRSRRDNAEKNDGGHRSASLISNPSIPREISSVRQHRSSGSRSLQHQHQQVDERNNNPDDSPALTGSGSPRLAAALGRRDRRGAGGRRNNTGSNAYEVTSSEQQQRQLAASAAAAASSSLSRIQSSPVERQPQRPQQQPPPVRMGDAGGLSSLVPLAPRVDAATAAAAAAAHQSHHPNERAVIAAAVEAARISGQYLPHAAAAAVHHANHPHAAAAHAGHAATAPPTHHHNPYSGFYNFYGSQHQDPAIRDAAARQLQHALALGGGTASRLTPSQLADGRLEAMSMRRETQQQATAAGAAPAAAEQDREMFCKVTRRDLDTGAETNIGFVNLPSRNGSTFAHLRVAIESDLDLPDDYEWRFLAPNLGPMSVKQEAKFGAIYAFLEKSSSTSTSGDSKNRKVGDGSMKNPVTVVIVDFSRH